MTVTELRKNIFKIFNEVIETGKIIEIECKGKKIQILCEESSPKLSRLKKPEKIAFVGNSDDIINIDWSKEWKEKYI